MMEHAAERRDGRGTAAAQAQANASEGEGEDMSRTRQQQPTTQVARYDAVAASSPTTKTTAYTSLGGDAYSDDEEAVTASLLSEPLLADASPGPDDFERKTVAMGVRQLGKQGAIVLLCSINLLNYIDRGIIPGAPEKFDQFITDTLGVSVLRQSVYFGLLTSAFIASYSVFSIVFGYLSLSHRPFRIIALGMSVWVVAVVICGAAQAADSYYVLILGRVVSGVGEASFQCTATPFINRHAPPARRALYLGIYLASVTVGTALGYIYGSLFASSSLGWGAAYYLEGVLMAGFIVCCLVLVPEELNRIPTNDDAPQDQSALADTKAEDVHDDDDDDVAMVMTPADLEDKASVTAFLDSRASSPAPQKPSFVTEWWGIFSCLPFLLVILGHASYTFSLAAMSTFSPAIFIGLGLFESETSVSLIFGGLVAVTGTIGTPVGGLLVDKLAQKTPGVPGRRCLLAVRSLFYFMVASVAFGLVMTAFASTKWVCMAFLTLCLFCMCALSVPETIAVLELFPESRRAMAIAANTLVIHALGDVPSPIILGAIKDAWAPLCGTVEIDGEATLNPRCSEDHNGLRDVLLFAVLWLAWGVLLWGAALVMLKRRQGRQQQRGSMLSRF